MRFAYDAVVKRNGHTLYISIPAAFVKKMMLEPGDVVAVAIEDRRGDE